MLQDSSISGSTRLVSSLYVETGDGDELRSSTVMDQPPFENNNFGKSQKVIIASARLHETLQHSEYCAFIYYLDKQVTNEWVETRITVHYHQQMPFK